MYKIEVEYLVDIDGLKYAKLTCLSADDDQNTIVFPGKNDYWFTTKTPSYANWDRVEKSVGKIIKRLRRLIDLRRNSTETKPNDKLIKI